MTLSNTGTQALATEAPRNYMPDMGPEDFSPPEFRLVQGMSDAHTQYNVPEGRYYNEATGENTGSLSFAIVSYKRTRALWESGSRNAPICQSDDRNMPRPGGTYPGPCKVCPGKAEGCYEGYDLMCLRIDPDGQLETIRNQDMFLLRINGLSVFPFKKFWTEARMKYGNKFWGLRIVLGSDKKTNAKGTFFTMAPTWVEITDPESRQELMTIAEAMMGMSEQDSNEPPAAPPGQTKAAPAAKAPPATVEGQRVTPRLVNKDEAMEIVALVKEFSINPDQIPAYINNAFHKGRVMELNTGEWSMLKAWIYQEFQPKRQPEPPAIVDDLPF